MHPALAAHAPGGGQQGLRLRAKLLRVFLIPRETLDDHAMKIRQAGRSADIQQQQEQETSHIVRHLRRNNHSALFSSNNRMNQAGAFHSGSNRRSVMPAPEC